MTPRQRDGVLILCGLHRTPRRLCWALLASGENPAVTLANPLQPTQLAPAEPGPGPVRRYVLTCNSRVVVDGKTRRCGPRMLRVDQGLLVDAVARLGGRGELVLGVDV